MFFQNLTGATSRQAGSNTSKHTGCYQQHLLLEYIELHGMQMQQFEQRY